MRLSLFGSVVRALAFLLPAAIFLFIASRASIKKPELSDWRVEVFRWGRICAWIAMALFLVASIDQLKIRGVSGVWFGINLFALSLAVLGWAGAFAGKGMARALMLCWGVLLAFGILAVVATTIP